MSDRQTHDLGNLLRAAVCKHRPEITTLAKTRGEMVFIRRVRVDRTRTPQEALKATGCVQYGVDSVVADMPRGDGDEVELVFIPLLDVCSDEGVDLLLNSFNLKSADPYSQAQANEDDPALADGCPNATRWKKDDTGFRCSATFSRSWRNERIVRVDRTRKTLWPDEWWFVCTRR